MDSLITIPVLNNVNIPVNIRATLGNLVRHHDVDDGKTMDSNLVAQALRQHGTPLLRWLEAEQREHLPQAVIDRAYRNEFASSRGSELGDATFNVRLNQFIARKADLLFKRQAQIHHEVQPVPSDDTYAIMPPLESFMGIPAHYCRQHFFKSVEKGDVLVGVVTSVMESGLVIQILCMDNEKVRDLDALKIMAFCPANEITQLHKHFSPTENFQIQDLVRGVVILVTAESEKVVLSLHNSRMAGLADISLGLITEEQFPVHYRRRLAVKGLTFEELMESILGFKNSGNRKYLTEFHRLQDRESYMRSLNSLEIPDQEYADNVRKLQSARKAHQSVLQGVTLFKQGNYLEAMQHLNRALQIDEKNVEGLVARGALYANKESYSRAIEDFEEALKEDPHHVNAYTYLVETLLALAKQHEEKKEWTDAETVYYRVLSVYPEHPEATADLKIVQQKKYQPSSGQFEKFDAITDSFMDLIKERKPGELTNRRSWSSSSDDRSPGRRRSSNYRKGSRSPDSKYRRRRSRDRSRSADKSRGRRSRSIESRKDRRKDSKRRKSKSPIGKRGQSKSPESTKDRRKSKSSPGKSSEKSKKNKKEKENKRDEDKGEEKSKKKKNKSKSRSRSPSLTNSQTFQKPTLKLKPESDLKTSKKKQKVLTPDKDHDSSSPEWGERPSTLHITRTRTNSFDEDEYLYGDSAIGYEKETIKPFPGFQEDSSTKTQNEEVLFEDSKSPGRISPQRKQSRDRKKEREVLKLKSFDEDSRSPKDKRDKSQSPDLDRSRDKRDSERDRPSHGKERSHKKTERRGDSSDSDGSRDHSVKDDKLREKSKKNRDKYKSPERSRKDKSSQDISKSDKKHSKRRDSESPNGRRSKSRSSSDERPNRSKRRSNSNERSSRRKRRSPSVEGPTRSKRRSISGERPSKRKRRSSSDERPSRSRRRSSSNEQERRKPEVSKKKRDERRFSSSPEDKTTSKKSSQRSRSKDEVKETGKESSGGVSKRRSRWDKSPKSPDSKSNSAGATRNEKGKMVENKGGWSEVAVKKGSSVLYPDPPKEADMFSGPITRTVYRSPKVAELKPTQVVEPMKSKSSFFVPRQIVISKKPDGKSSNSEQVSTRLDSRGDRSQSRSRSRSTDPPVRKSSRESKSRRSPDKSRDRHRDRSASKESHASHKTDRSPKVSEDPPRGKKKNRSISRDRSRHSDNSRSRSRERHPKSLPRSRKEINRLKRLEHIYRKERCLGPRRNIGLANSSSACDDRRISGHRGRSESEDEKDDRGRKSNKSINRSKSRSKSRERSRRSPSPDRRQKQHGKDSSNKRYSQSDSDDSPQPKRRDERKNRDSYSEQKDLNKKSTSPDVRKSRRSTIVRDDSSSPEIPRKKDQSKDKNSKNRKKSRSPVRNKSGKRSRSRSSSDNDDRSSRKLKDDPSTSSKPPKQAKRQFAESKEKVKTPTKSPGGKKVRKFIEEESESKYKGKGKLTSSSSRSRSRSRSPSPNRREAIFRDKDTPPPAVKSKWDSSPKASRWDPPAQPQAKQFTFKPVGSPTAKNTLTQLETFLLKLKQKKKQGDEDTPLKQDKN